MPGRDNQLVGTSKTPQALLRRDDACKRLAISLATYKRLLKAGRLVEVAIGRARRLPESEIERFLQSVLTA
jgi:excisionase family DNA binding protein